MDESVHNIFIGAATQSYFIQTKFKKVMKAYGIIKYSQFALFVFEAVWQRLLSKKTQ